MKTTKPTPINISEDQLQKPPIVSESVSSSAASSAPEAPASAKRKKGPIIIMVALLVAAALGTAWWMYVSGREETDDAYVDGHISNISSRVSGTVTNVLVEENQNVKQDQLLVQLDPRDYQVKVDEDQAALEMAQHQAAAAQSKIGQSSLSAVGQTTQASGDLSSGQAEVDAARAALMQAHDSVRIAEGKLREASAQVQYAKADFERYEAVFADKAVTKQQYDKAKTNLDVVIAQRGQAFDNLENAKKQRLQAQANLHNAEGKLARSKGTVTAAVAATKQEQIDKESFQSYQSAVKRDEVALEQAKLQLSYCRIVAPVDGRIGKKSVEVGQRVEPGQALLSLVYSRPWITANFKETQVGRMHVGQPVEITIDAFPGKKFEGKIDSLSPASGAKFSMLPPDNATGNFTKVVQRIPVKIVFSNDIDAATLKRVSPGMSCVCAVLCNKR